ncbi:YtxH domain-containing protein [Candidatus Saccharibacteria bacterium]|nr:YtxH domain-containing protein [Candidatus Saccharibacteria bacterium]
MKKSTGHFVLGTIFGMALGAIAGVLSAPKSGKETRAEIKAKGGKIYHDQKENLGKIYHEQKSNFGKFKQKFAKKAAEIEDEIVEPVEDTVSDLTDDTEE